MDPKRKILAYLSRRDAATGGALRAHLGLSRQALSVHIRSLVEAGKVVRSGTTRGARYTVASRAPAPAVVSRPLLTRGLDEGRVWDDLAARLNLRRVLRPNVEAIVRYAFTEMLNNAIEHAESDRCAIRFSLGAGAVSFQVHDPGIGAFHSIASKLHLPDEETALVELLKGRTTTMREAHTGEGLFFTSKVADRFVSDLGESVAYVRDTPNIEGGMAPIYGLAASIPDRSIVHEMLKLLMDVYYRL